MNRQLRQNLLVVLAAFAIAAGGTFGISSVSGQPAAVYAPVPQEAFTMAEDTATAPPTSPTPSVAPSDWDERLLWLAREVNRTPMPTPTASPTPRPTPRATPRPKPRATSRPVAPKTSHSIAGKASWYCKAGVSVCHYKYPPGSMVAAACGKLRAAIGSSWRGRTVVVKSGGRQVTVRLVDWCGSSTKLIDLYFEAMRRLGGTGVLPVTVRW